MYGRTCVSILGRLFRCGYGSQATDPQATFDGENLYPDRFTNAAPLMESLVQNHPFVDGNKRTGIAAAALALR